MNFASDNVFGVSPIILEALQAHNEGTARSYGADHLTARVKEKLSDIFEKDVTIFLVPTGTAANALILSEFCPSYGAIYCHNKAHILIDECGATEFFSHGAKLFGVDGMHGKMGVAQLKLALSEASIGHAQNSQPKALSITQATETGLVYSVDELEELCSIAKHNNLKVHMDGARFANAVISTGVKPADLTWRAGVDGLTFGATKNGGLSCEVMVFFDDDHHDTLKYRITQSGHLLSKSRFMAAQILAYLENDHWLDLAKRANDSATHLCKELSQQNRLRLPWHPEANEVFAVMENPLVEHLRDNGALFSVWPYKGLGDNTADDESLVRLVTSFNTETSQIHQFLNCISNY